MFVWPCHLCTWSYAYDESACQRAVFSHLFLLQMVCSLAFHAFSSCEAMVLDLEDTLGDRQTSSYWLCLRPFNAEAAVAFVAAVVSVCFSLYTH